MYPHYCIVAKITYKSLTKDLLDIEQSYKDVSSLLEHFKDPALILETDPEVEKK